MFGVSSNLKDKLMALDCKKKWVEGTVVGIRGDGAARELNIHFRGWSKRWDEWIRVGEGKLKMPGAVGRRDTNPAHCRQGCALTRSV